MNRSRASHFWTIGAQLSGYPVMSADAPEGTGGPSSGGGGVDPVPGTSGGAGASATSASGGGGTNCDGRTESGLAAGGGGTLRQRGETFSTHYGHEGTPTPRRLRGGRGKARARSPGLDRRAMINARRSSKFCRRQLPSTRRRRSPPATSPRPRGGLRLWCRSFRGTCCT